MTELIIIKTNNGKEVKKFLEEKHINYEIYQENPTKKISEEELEQAYRECYANNPHLLELSTQWEKAQNEDWINWEKENKRKK